MVELRKSAAQQLSQISDTPMLDAELLLMHVLNVDRSYLRTHEDQSLTSQQQAQFESFMARRLMGEPVAYIIGKKEFWSMTLNVTRDTLIPRPDTETLVETVLQLIVDEYSKVVDLGTGSGAVALALASERPNWEIFATDISENALHIANNNAQQFKITNISFLLGSWCTALPCSDFNAIVSNPPYISEEEWSLYSSGLAYEPRQALVSGRAGMLAIEEIAQAAGRYLLPGGYLVFEHGYRQAEAVRNILAINGYINIQSVADLSGNQRVSYGQKIN